MKKLFWVSSFVFVLISFFVFVDARGCPITDQTDVVIYGSTGNGGVGSLSKSWMEHFFVWWESYNPGLEYVFVSYRDLKRNCDLSSYPNVQLYVQPGGNAYLQQKSLGSEGKSNILSYVGGGGSYFGACAGWYYASSDYFWQDSFYDHPYLLGLFPTVEGSIRAIADYDENPGYAMAPLANGFNALYYGGPTQGMRDTSLQLPATGVVETSYTGSLSHLPAVVKSDNLLLTSVHLEAFENDGITGLSSVDRVENYKLLANLLNEVSGMAYVVPSYATPSQCSDGVDNDGDLLVDFPFDPGCSSSFDDNETDPSTGGGSNQTNQTNQTGLIFSDDFESGSLSSWSVYGPGRSWKVSSQDPYLGSFHAQSKRSGAGDPTYLEMSVSTEGFFGLTLNYYRKLVGLDAADDFSVEFFDGGQWQVLEHVSSTSNSVYVFKSFSLPVSADDNSLFKLRFMCEAGAVSEYCRVDDVELVSL